MLFETELERIHSLSLNRILALIGVGFILLSLIIILITPSAANYEFSIYDAYPLIFWLALFAAIVTGSVILLINGVFKEQDKSKWIWGILIIFLANSILLFMPLIRGYLNFGSGDVLTHIGWMKDIIRTGYVSSSNMYPIDHILGVILNFFTGLSFQEITMIIPALFSLFFIVSFYLLSTVIFSKQSERLLLVLFASILMFGNLNMAFAPNAQAFMVLPFLLYLLFKSNTFEGDQIFSILLIIICTTLVFFHPLVTLISISIFILLKIPSLISKKLDITGAFNKNLNKLIFLLIVLFSSWTSYLYVLAKTAQPIFETITGSSEYTTEFQSYSNILGEVHVDISYLVRLIISIYGQEIILGILSLICAFYLLLKVIRGEKISNISLIALISFLTLFIISIFMFFINGIFGFNRIYYCAMIFSIILIPSMWFMMNSDFKTNIILTRIVLLAVLAAIVWISMFNLYFSPITKQVNQQVTKSEYFGMITFYKYRDESYQILEYGLSQDRMYDAIYGRDYPRTNVVFSASDSLMPPDHFGYNMTSSLGSFYNEPHYFLLTNAGKFYYPNIYPEFPQKWRFDANDFERLKTDVSVQQIYDNGNLDIRLIYNEQIL
jgi:hypothetical protein